MPKFDPAAVLDDLTIATNGRPNQFTPEVAAGRRREQTRRLNDARYRAFKALSRLHADEYEALRLEALRRINAAAAAPLPGDD